MIIPSKKPSRRSKKKTYRLLLWSIGITASIVLLVLLVTIALLLSKNDIKDSIKDSIVTSEDIPALQKDTSVPENKEPLPEEKPVDYPMPEYNFTLEEVYVPIEGLKKEYTLAWVSDLHMIPQKDNHISAASQSKLESRYKDLPVTPEGVPAEKLWPEIVKCLNYGNYDAVIFGGDMMDYCSEDNMKLFKEGYDNLKYHKEQLLYIRSDHDYGAWYASGNFTQDDIYKLHKELDGDNLEQKYLDMEEFTLIGINDSTKNITQENFSIVEKHYQNAASQNKPVIAVTHAPYGSNVDESLKALSMKVRNTPYYWVGPDYQPDDTMWSYLELIFKEDTQVKQVLAGHLHAPWDGMITKQLREHIFSPAFNGTIGVIHIVPAGQEKENTSHKLRPEENASKNNDTVSGNE